jgi:hypothetical protein
VFAVWKNTGRFIHSHADESRLMMLGLCIGRYCPLPPVHPVGSEVCLDSFDWWSVEVKKGITTRLTVMLLSKQPLELLIRSRCSNKGWFKSVRRVGGGRRTCNAAHERMNVGMWDRPRRSRSREDGLLSCNPRNVRYIQSMVAGEIGRKEIEEEDLSFYRLDSQKECLQTLWGG